MSITRITLAASLVLAASQAAGQSAPNGASNHWSATSASELIARAEQIQNLDSLQIKAKLLVQAAGLMTGDDPRRARC